MTLTYDFSEAAEGGDFVTLERGRYVFEVIKIEAGKSDAGNPKAIVTLKVNGTEPKNEVWVGGLINQHWPTTGKASFRFRDFITAIGAKPKGKGKMSLGKYVGSEIGATVTVTESDREDSDMLFNDLRSIVPGEQMRKLLGLDDEPEEDEEWDEDEEDEEDEDWEDEDEDDEDDEEEDEDEEDEDEDEEEEITREEIEGMKKAELLELAEEWELNTRPPKGKKTLTVALLRKRVLKEYDSYADEDEEDEEPF